MSGAALSERDEGLPDTPRARADESVAARFSRIMNATTSPLGVLSDPPAVAVASGVLLIAFLAALRLDAGPAVPILAVLAATPLTVAVGITLALLGARRRVVDWLASLPFPVENMNAVLNGLGEGLEVTFDAERPAQVALNEALDRVHPDTFVTRREEGESTVEIRLGVVDSKRNPAASNHARYARLQRIVKEVLVPLEQSHRIVSVRVK